nr:unnamed protein product [Callosobruchus analis]
MVTFLLTNVSHSSL